MSLASRLEAFAQAVATDVKALQSASADNTAGRIVKSAAVSLKNNCRTRDADSSIISLTQHSSYPSADSPTSWQIDPSSSACVFNYSGGNPQSTGSGVWFPSTTYNSSTGQADLFWRAETETDAQVMVISVTSWGGAGPRFIVNGTYYSLTGLANTSGVSVGSQMWIKITFSPSAKKTLVIEGRYEIRFIAAYTAENAALTKPAEYNQIKMAYVGDSNAFVYGYDTKGDSYAIVLADCLGISDSRISAIYGTGLQATNSGTNYNYVERLSDITGTAGLDLVMFSMSWNDWNYGSGYSAAQIKIAAASLISATRTAHPNAVILINGVNTWDIAPSDEIGLDGHEAAVLEAVVEASDPLVGFISVRSSAASPILYGGSTTSGTHANRYVNTSIDHLTPAGNLYVGKWLADKVFAKLVEMSGKESPAVTRQPAAGAQSSSSNVFIQETDPALLTPYIWYKTDSLGRVVDILKGGS